MTGSMRMVIVGNGKMASDILRLVAGYPGMEAVGAVGNDLQEAAQSRLATCCEELGLPYISTPDINEPGVVQKLQDFRPTYLVSANNFQIFRSPSLLVPEKGVINFHNGPLPRYGGLNACSWALFNGEKEHGVTWHLVDAGIDSGPILAQRRFSLEPDERAITLVARCIREGIGLFAELLPALAENRAHAVPQNHQGRLYYGAKARPFDGHFPWWARVEELRRLENALSFHPLPNTFYHPMFRVEGYAPVYAGDFSVELSDEQEAGVIAVSQQGLTIQMPDAAATIETLYDADGHEVSAVDAASRFGLVDGARLLRP